MSLGKVELFFYLLHVVTHLWKLQSYHAILFWYGTACQKFSEVANCQYLWEGLSDFLVFLHVFVVSVTRGE